MLLDLPGHGAISASLTELCATVLAVLDPPDRLKPVLRVLPARWATFGPLDDTSHHEEREVHGEDREERCLSRSAREEEQNQESQLHGTQETDCDPTPCPLLLPLDHHFRWGSL